MIFTSYFLKRKMRQSLLKKKKIFKKINYSVVLKHYHVMPQHSFLPQIYVIFSIKCMGGTKMRDENSIKTPKWQCENNHSFKRLS